jgi:hypothetical protein
LDEKRLDQCKSLRCWPSATVRCGHEEHNESASRVLSEYLVVTCLAFFGPAET